MDGGSSEPDRDALQRDGAFTGASLQTGISRALQHGVKQAHGLACLVVADGWEVRWCLGRGVLGSQEEPGVAEQPCTPPLWLEYD